MCTTPYVDVVTVGGDGDSDSNVESEDIQWSDCGGNATMVLMLGPRHRWTPSDISIHRQKCGEGDDDGEEDEDDDNDFSYSRIEGFLKIVIKSGGKIVSSNLTALYLEMNEMWLSPQA